MVWEPIVVVSMLRGDISPAAVFDPTVFTEWSSVQYTISSPFLKSLPAIP